ncbi:MAG: hypothetical protein ABI573_03405 [Chloroflexota bacterium]
MTDPENPTTARDVQYKGAPLDSEKGPGLGCFWSQIVVLVTFLILTPLSVAWSWPFQVSAFLLISVLVLLLVAGQTIIFLLRLIAADRRAEGRRRPLASRSMTVGEIEDADAATNGADEDVTTPAEPKIAADPDPNLDAAATGAHNDGVRE